MPPARALAPEGTRHCRLPRPPCVWFFCIPCVYCRRMEGPGYWLGSVYCVYVGAGCCGDNGLLPIKLYLRPVSCLCDFISTTHTFPRSTEHPPSASLWVPMSRSAQAGKDTDGDRCGECEEGSDWGQEGALGSGGVGRGAGGHTLLSGGGDPAERVCRWPEGRPLGLDRGQGPSILPGTCLRRDPEFSEGSFILFGEYSLLPCFVLVGPR